MLLSISEFGLNRSIHSRDLPLADQQEPIFLICSVDDCPCQSRGPAFVTEKKKVGYILLGGGNGNESNSDRTNESHSTTLDCRKKKARFCLGVTD